jgi:5-(carboxyamino)imidazole ribonucleotide synthase
MIGAGQLARMTHQAAVDLDVELAVLADAPGDPAAVAGAPAAIGSFRCLDDLVAATAAGEVVTFDHELVPAPLLADLEEAGRVLRPGRKALAMAQDKLLARRRLAGAGFPVPAFAPVDGPAELARFAAEHGWPVVLKARSGGYDGRGVLVLPDARALPPDLDWTPADDGQARWLAEEHLELTAELAVLVARRPSGGAVTYPVVQTTQEDGICRHLFAPAAVSWRVAEQAARLAARLAEEIDASGICAVEMFVGPGDRLLVNELALRPHNSGHATIEGNVTSQFHQHIRAVLDWPLGATDLRAPVAAMVNVITPDRDADPVANLPAALEVPGASIHLYGKSSRAGRKVGHVTATGESAKQALGVAQRAVDALLGGAARSRRSADRG